MTKKTKVIIVCTTLILTFVAGRYSVTYDVKESTKKVNTNEVSKKENKEETIVEIERPDGTKEKTTIITYNREETAKTDKTTEATIDKKSNAGRVTVNALVGYQFSNSLVYGGQISTKLIGPTEIGVFGLTSGVVGVTLGLRL